MRSLAWPARALILYVALLPFHSLLITLLLAQAHVPLPMLKGVAAWKEVLLFATFVGALAVAVARKDLPALVWVDWVALAWLCQVLLYFVFADVLFDQSPRLLAKLYGMRDWLLYVVPYAIGNTCAPSKVAIACGG